METKNKKIDFIPININKYKGGIPTGYDLVVAEKSEVSKPDFDGSATILYGFDEIGLFEEGLNEPQYGFLKMKYL